MTIYKSGYTNEEKIAFFDAIEKALQERIAQIEEELRYDFGYIPDFEFEHEVDKNILTPLDDIFAIDNNIEKREAFFYFDKLIADISDMAASEKNPFLKTERAA